MPINKPCFSEIWGHLLIIIFRILYQEKRKGMQNWGEALKIFETKRYCVKTEGCGGSGTFYEQLDLKGTFKNISY